MFIPIHDANPLRSIPLHYATIGLIAANVVMFLFVEGNLILGDKETGTIALAFIPRALVDAAARPEAYSLVPEPATLLTYAFVHADFWHLAGNMLFLWVFGDNVEDAVGHWRFIAFYLLCALGAALAHFAFAAGGNDALVGASGAVAGIIAAYLVLHPRVRVWILLLFKIPLRLPAFWVLGAWIALQVWSIYAGAQVDVGWWAHIGGLVTGGLLIVLMRRPGVELFDRGLEQEA